MTPVREALTQLIETWRQTAYAVEHTTATYDAEARAYDRCADEAEHVLALLPSEETPPAQPELPVIELLRRTFDPGGSCHWDGEDGEWLTAHSDAIDAAERQIEAYRERIRQLEIDRDSTRDERDRLAKPETPPAAPARVPCDDACRGGFQAGKAFCRAHGRTWAESGLFAPPAPDRYESDLFIRERVALVEWLHEHAGDVATSDPIMSGQYALWAQAVQAAGPAPAVSRDCVFACPGTPPTAWRDIATAPKDGTTILVGASDWMALTNSFTDGRWWTWHPTLFGIRPMRNNGRAEPPTHWHPLPPAPAPQPRGGTPQSHAAGGHHVRQHRKVRPAGNVAEWHR